MAGVTSSSTPQQGGHMVLSGEGGQTRAAGGARRLRRQKAAGPPKGMSWAVCSTEQRRNSPMGMLDAGAPPGGQPPWINTSPTDGAFM